MFESPEFQQAIANIILLVVTGVVGAIAKAVYSYLKIHTTANQFQMLQELATSAVRTAEMGAIGGFVTDKKATAIAVVNEGLKNAGIRNLSAEQIEAAIEAAVKFEYNHDVVPGETTPEE
jgi:LL-H family phage holin